MKKKCKANIENNNVCHDDVSYNVNDLHLVNENHICSEAITRAKKRKFQSLGPVCIFCELNSSKGDMLYQLKCDSGFKKLLEALKCGYAGLKVKLSANFNHYDVESQNIMYHKSCWTKNVENILREKHSHQNKKLQNSTYAIEFINMLESYLLEGNVTNMAYLEDKYKTLAMAYNVDECYLKNRKQLRILIDTELPNIGVEYTAPIRKNESYIISLKTTKNVALRNIIETSRKYENDMKVGRKYENDMKVLHEASLILRKHMFESEVWNFDGSLKNIDLKSIVPKELFFFFKWCITDIESMESYEKPIDYNSKNEVEKRSLNLSQILMYESLSKRQSRNESSSSLRHSREFPLQVANGLIVHNLARSQVLVDIFHKIGCSIDYFSVMKIETQIANAVIRKMDENDGVFIPENIIRHKRLWFAADNIDFQERTPDGKGTLHGTVITAYQEMISSEDTERLNLCGIKRDGFKLKGLNENQNQSTERKKRSKTTKPVNEILESNNFRESQIQLVNSTKMNDFAWFFLQANSTFRKDSEKPFLIPNWSSYNSLLSSTMPRARVFVLPLLSTSSTEISTQLKVLDIVEKLNLKVYNNTKAVLTLDMGLYQPMQQLLMFRPELKPNFVLRPGELHIIMAMLRSIGSFINGSGIPEAWSESNLYDASVIKQILDGSVRRGIAAHLSTLCSLYICYFDEFYENNTVQNLDSVKLKLQQFQHIFAANKFEEVIELHEELLAEINTIELFANMKKFDAMMGPQRPTKSLCYCL